MTVNSKKSAVGKFLLLLHKLFRLKIKCIVTLFLTNFHIDEPMI